MVRQTFICPLLNTTLFRDFKLNYRKMKLLFSIFIMCSISCKLTAQANLVFNQVKNIMGIITISNSTINNQPNNIVVPAGKVLKIESASLSNNGFLSQYTSLLIGNHNVYSGSNFTGGVNTFPFWLSEGSYSVEMTVSGNGINQAIKYSISGIEFNVVP